MMRFIRVLAAAFFLLNCGGASANWRDDNPNQPNGYEASMLRYHYGTPDDDGPHDGYQATMIRNRNGLDRFAPPDNDDDGWGKSDSGSGRFGGGGGLGRHFRQGQAEGAAYWREHMQTQVRARMAASAGGGYGQYQSGLNRMPNDYSAAGGYGRGTAYGYNQDSDALANQRPADNFNYGRPEQENYGNYQCAANKSLAQDPYGNQSTALRQAVRKRPVSTLLRNSRGGFNRMYTGQ